MNTSIFVNGKFVGFHENGRKLTEELREKRRSNEISPDVNIAFFEKSKELFVNTDEGRAVRPLIVVEGGKNKYTKQLQDKVKAGELTWNDLVKKGVIEYLDAEEEENTHIAFKEQDLTPKHTHLEIDAAQILGYASSMVPFPEHNSSPRVLMASQHSKQSLGLYASNYALRTDTRAHLLFYPHKPLVQTDIYRSLCNEKRASGQNFIVAVLSYKGFNMNDAIVINQSSVERGLGRSAFFRNYGTEEKKYPGGQRDKFEKPQEFVQGFLGEEAYKDLGEDGIVNPETQVNGDSVLVGKTSPPRFLKEVTALDVDTERRRESSVTVRGNESGTVDSIFLTQTTGGNKLVKIKVRKTCIPEIGDKFASRLGQKGVVSLMLRQEDMPFTKEGITPDLIINPHAIPGRMTAGHLLDMLAGKAACADGRVRDGSAFSSDEQQEFEKALLEKGFHPTGQEVMYEPSTGRRLFAKIFVGVGYYQRLHHLVSLKIHARSRGPVQMLTHQPTEGRAREGGLRLGEMERDCFFGFGAASLLRERMIDSSDKTVQLVCSNCGTLAVDDRIKKKISCPLCESTKIEDVEMSYAFKLLLDEMKSIGIYPKLKLRERG